MTDVEVLLKSSKIYKTAGIECEKRSLKIQNGLVLCSDSFQSGSRCTYKCNKGYVLSSSNSISTCLYSGRWSSNPPVCNPVVCDGNTKDFLMVC